MKGVDTLHIKPATKAYNKINTLGSSHLTTLDTGQIVPLWFMETVPGGKYNVPSQHFIRTTPLVKPTYGNFSYRTVAGFVPFTQVAYDADAYIGGKTVFEGKTPVGRFIGMYDFTTYFVTLSYGLTSVVNPPADYDFSVVGANGSRSYFKFTDYGKYVYKVLCSLGYAFPQNVDRQTGSTWTTTVGAWKLNAYNLLCFAKLYNDYMSQSQRFNSSQLTDFLRCVKYDITTTGYNSGGYITNAGLDIIFKNIKLAYENDYFTSCWQNPNSPLLTSESIAAQEVPAPMFNGQLVRNTTNDQYLDVNQSGDVNQRGLDMLRAFDDWVRRNNYSGSHIVQQVYSRFGIKSDDYRSHYAHIINRSVSPVQIGDVTATASTTGAVLGDYAGKAIVSEDINFSYQASDRGILMVLGYITLKPMNPYGLDRTVLHSKPLDFYTPEFDGIGANAVSYGELFCNPRDLTASADTSIDNVVFGFTERYNEYRFGRDRITGEFRNFINNADMNTWHTGRLLTNVRAAGEMIAQSSAMNTFPQYSSEFNRIFAHMSGDHFYLVARFNVTAMLPILSPNQVPDLGEGDTVVAKNGNEIN